MTVLKQMLHRLTTAVRIVQCDEMRVVCDERGNICDGHHNRKIRLYQILKVCELRF